MNLISDNITFTLVVFFTICSWLILGYLLWTLIQERRHPKLGGNEILGLVTNVVSTDEGLTIFGQLTEHGQKIVKARTSGFMSVGCSVGSSAVAVEPMSNAKIIKEARLHSVSLNREPGPYGGKIETINKLDPSSNF